MSTTAKDLHFVLSRLFELGIPYDDAQKLRRISMTLRRWFELECGDSDNYKSWSIERDEATDRPFMVIHPHNAPNWPKIMRNPVADREKGARKRLAAIMARYPKLYAYIQTDPRGVALYIINMPTGCKASHRAQWADENCSTRGVAVY